MYFRYLFRFSLISCIDDTVSIKAFNMFVKYWLHTKLHTKLPRNIIKTNKTSKIYKSYKIFRFPRLSGVLGYRILREVIRRTWQPINRSSRANDRTRYSVIRDDHLVITRFVFLPFVRYVNTTQLARFNASLTLNASLQGTVFHESKDGLVERVNYRETWNATIALANYKSIKSPYKWRMFKPLMWSQVK